MTQRSLAVLALMAGGLLLVACWHSAQRVVPPQPVIDMHFHAMAADDQGPPPLAMCMSGESLPVWDQRQPWPKQFIEWLKSPACSNPVWSPKTDEELMQQSLDVLRKHDITAVTSGGRVDLIERWQAAEPTRVIPTLQFNLAKQPPSVETVRQ
jgi:hypothetical protein